MIYTVDKKKIANNTIALYLRMGLTMVIGFYMTRIMLVQLGSEDYGLNNLVGSIVSLMGFINSSMGTAVQRFFSLELGKDEGNSNNMGKIFSTGLYLHILVALISFVVAEFFALFFLERLNIPSERLYAAHIVFQISVVSMFIGIVTVPYFSLLRAREMFSKMALYDIIQAVLRLTVVIILAYSRYDKLILLSFLNFGVTLCYTYIMVKMALEFREAHNRPSRNPVLIKQMLSFVSLLTLTVLSNLINTKGIVVLVNLFYGLLVNAAFAVAIQVQNVVSTFVMNFKQSIVPQMMSAYGAGDLLTMHKLITIGTKITFLLMLMVSLPIVFEVDFLLNLWLKTPPTYTSSLVVLTIININISSFTYFLYQGVHATGNISGQQIWISISYVLGILLTYMAFIFNYSFYSALIVAMIISFLQCIINVVFSRLKYRYSISCFLHLSSRCLLTTLITSVMIFVIDDNMSGGWMRLATVTLSSLLLVAVLGFVFVLNKDEKNAIKNYLPNNKIFSLL